MKEKVLNIATAILYGISTVLLYVSVIGETWVKIQDQDGAHLLDTGQIVTLNGEEHAHHGLWAYCQTSNCNQSAHFHFGENQVWFQAAQICAVMAIVFGTIGFIASLIRLWDPTILGVMMTIDMFIACICITIASSIFADKEDTNDTKQVLRRVWGWTFVVAWFTCLLTLVASALALVTVCSNVDRKEKYRVSFA